MAQFYLFLYDQPGSMESVSPEEMQKALEKYMAWGQLPFVTNGLRLGADPGRVVRSTGGQPRATDGPYSETKEVLGGYYSIEAADYDEAVKLTLDHPHVEYGGTIEIRAPWAP